MQKTSQDTQADIDAIKQIANKNIGISIEKITDIYLQNKKANQLQEVGEMALPMLMNIGNTIEEIKNHFLPS